MNKPRHQQSSKPQARRSRPNHRAVIRNGFWFSLPSDEVFRILSIAQGRGWEAAISPSRSDNGDAPQTWSFDIKGAAADELLFILKQCLWSGELAEVEPISSRVSWQRKIESLIEMLAGGGVCITIDDRYAKIAELPHGAITRERQLSGRRPHEFTLAEYHRRERLVPGYDPQRANQTYWADVRQAIESGSAVRLEVRAAYDALMRHLTPH